MNFPTLSNLINNCFGGELLLLIYTKKIVGKTFIVECDALKRVRITANFVNGETLEEIMTVLEKTTDIRYTISDDVITIQK